MRQIKFRAWDSDRKKMVFEFCNEIDSVEYALITNEENELLCGNYMDNGDWQEPKLMQFTGLTDKNGVDIYEGDIFKKEHKINQLLSGGYSNIGFCYYEVCFEKASFFGKQTKVDESLINYFSEGKIYYNLKENLNNIEVIGNIFENN